MFTWRQYFSALKVKQLTPIQTVDIAWNSSNWWNRQDVLRSLPNFAGTTALKRHVNKTEPQAITAELCVYTIYWFVCVESGVCSGNKDIKCVYRLFYYTCWLNILLADSSALLVDGLSSFLVMVVCLYGYIYIYVCVCIVFVHVYT